MFAVTAQAGDGSIVRSQRPLKNGYIIQFAQPQANIDEAVTHLVATHGGKIRHYFPGKPWSGYSVEELPEAAAIALSRNPLVHSVHEIAVGSPTQSLPPLDWGLDRIEQINLPLNGYTYARGIPANIYILDSGVNDPRGTEFTGPYGYRLVHGYTPVPNYYDDPIQAGHGTRVASLAAGNSYGVARAATVHNVKISTDADTDDVEIDRVIAGIRDYVNPTAAVTSNRDIANLSYFWMTSSTLLDDEIRHSIVNYNVAWVVGAGNGIPGANTGQGIDACQGTPARVGRPQSAGGPSAITVGATKLEADASVSGGWRDARATFSNYGQCVDVFAPGENVKVPAYVFSGSIGSWQDGRGSGTSFAAPLVAGELTYLFNSAAYTPTLAEQSLKTNSSSSGLINPNTLDPYWVPCTAATSCPTPNLLMYQYRRSRPSGS